MQYQVVHSLSVGRRSQEVLRVLAALQSGGLCREDWMADQPDDRSVSGDPAGKLFLALPDRGRGGLGDVRQGLPGPGPPARSVGGAQGLQARLPGDAERRPGRGPRGGRAQSSQPLHDLRRRRLGGRTDHQHGVHRRRIARQDRPNRPAADRVAPVDRPPDRLGNGGGPRRGHRARRPQAGERDGHRRGAGQGPRFRPGAAAAARSVRSAPTRRPSWGSPKPATASSARHGTSPPSRSAASPRPRPATSSPWESSSTSSRTGKPAFPADNLLQVLDQIRSVDPDTMAAETPEPFGSLLRQMLVGDPGQRSITMKEVADTLLRSANADRSLRSSSPRRRLARHSAESLTRISFDPF